MLTVPIHNIGEDLKHVILAVLNKKLLSNLSITVYDSYLFQAKTNPQ